MRAFRKTKSDFIFLAVIILSISLLSFKFLTSGIPFYYVLDLSGEVKSLSSPSSFFYSLEGWNPTYSTPPTYSSSFYPLSTSLIYLLSNNVWFSVEFLVPFQMIIAAIAMYFLAKYYSKSSFAGFSAAIFYMSTPYFFGELTGHPIITWVYSLTPLAYLFIDKALSTESVRFTALAGLGVAATTLLASPPYIYYNGIFFFLYIVMRIISFKSGLRKSFKKIIIALSIFALSLMVSAYILPLASPEPWPPSPYEVAAVTKVAFSSNSGISTYANLPFEALSLIDREAAVGLQGYWGWWPSWVTYLAPLTIILGSVIILRRRNPFYVYIMMILGIVSLGLAMSVNLPFTFAAIYEFFYNYFPLFYTIETPTRFLLTACLSFSLLAGISSKHLLEFTKRAKIQISYKKGLLLRGSGVLLLAFLITLPYVSAYYYSSLQSYTRTLTTVQMPADVSASNTLASQLGSDYQIWDLASPYGYVYDENSSSRSFWNGWNIVTMYYDEPYFAQLLAMLNVKYIIYDPVNTPQLFHDEANTASIFSGTPPNNLYDIIKNSEYFNISTIYPTGTQTLNLDPSIFVNSTISSENVLSSNINTINATGGAYFLDINAQFNATSNDKNSFLELSSGILNYSTSIYKELLYKAKVGWLGNTPNDLLTIIVEYSDGTSTASNYFFTGFSDCFGTVSFNLDPGKVVEQIKIRLEPTGELQQPQWLHADISTTQLYLFENTLAKPRIYSAQGVLAVGGPDAYSFYTLDNSSSLNWALFFANQILPQENLAEGTMNPYNLFLFYDTDLNDLVGLTSSRLDFYKYVPAENWTVIDTAVGSYPVQSQHVYEGQMVIADYPVSTENDSSIVLPYFANSSGYYSGLIRILGQPNSKKADVLVDGVEVTTGIDPSNYTGFKFIEFNNFYLTQGWHSITVKTYGAGELVLDTMVLMPTQNLQNLYDSLTSELQAYTGNFLFMQTISNPNQPTELYIPRDSTYHLTVEINYTSPFSGYLPAGATVLDKTYILKPPFDSGGLGGPWAYASRYFAVPSQLLQEANNIVYLTYLVNGTVTVHADSPYLGIPLVPTTTINETTTFALNLTNYANRPNGEVIAPEVLSAPGNISNLEEIVIGTTPIYYENSTLVMKFGIATENYTNTITVPYNESGSSQWTEQGTLPLQEGWQTLDLTNISEATPVEITLSEHEPIEDLLSNENETSLSVLSNENSNYLLNVTTSSPEFLVLTETCTQGWTMQSQNTIVPSQPAYFFINAFYINGTGNMTIKVNYHNPNTPYFNITYATVTVIILIQFIPVFKKVRNRINLNHTASRTVSDSEPKS